MEIVVRCFGPARVCVGGDTVALTLDAGARVSEALTALATMGPDLAALLPHCATAVGDEFVEREYQLGSGDELALLPPVAGG